jgi:hypothetical protein
MLSPMLAAALAIVLTIGPALVAIPDEPGAEVVASGSLVQAVVADLDGDGAREILALVGGDGGSIRLVGWRDGADGWLPMGLPIAVAAASNDPQVTWIGTPVRLVVRRVAGADHVTLVRQPEFLDGDPAERCCLLLHDVVAEDGRLRVIQATPRTGAVDAVWAVDLDGDVVDELVASRSLPPLGGISFPTEILVYRWADDRFTVTESRLEVGSGDTPFLLGDSDGRPGDELGLIATLGRPALYRLSLGSGDGLVVEDAGMTADAAAAVATEDGRGVAVLAGGALAVHSWPAGAALEPPIAQVPMADATILGTAELAGTESIVVRQTVGADRVHAFGLPTLLPPRFGAITRSPAAAAFGSGPVSPYVGPIPGGGADGRPALIYGGRLLASWPPVTPEPFTGVRLAAMAGAQPIGVVGPDRSEIAMLHAVDVPSVIDARGGRLDMPRVQPDAALTVAPFEQALTPELADAAFDPPITGAISLGPRRAIGVRPAGFVVAVAAPAGSRVHVAGLDPSVVARVLTVPPSGSLDVPMAAAELASPGTRYRASLGVTTPAGHSYLASWDVRVLDAPSLEVRAVTPLGSGEVEVMGRSAPFASVSVDGAPVALDDDGRFVVRRAVPPWPTDLTVTATDPLGGTTATTLTAVGWFDYRALPWIPIVAAGVAVAGTVLYVRQPRTRPMPRRADDDAGFEELEAD